MSSIENATKIAVLVEELLDCWEPAWLHRLPPEDLREPALRDEEIETRLVRLWPAPQNLIQVL